MNRILVATAFVFFNFLALDTSVHAQSGPQVNVNLKEAATLIPIPGIKDAVNQLFDNLKPFDNGNGFTAKVTVKNVPLYGDVPLLLYVFGDADKQAILLVVNRQIGIPGVFNSKAWRQLAGANFTDPIFSLSTVDFSLNAKDMPIEFQQIVANSYFNVDSLDFSSGFQTASRVHIGGIMKNVIEIGMGVPVQAFTLRAGVVLPVPSDPAGRAALAANILADMREVEKKPKDAPEFYAEFQLAPGKTISGPLGMSSMTLSDATISLNSTLVLSYKGNVSLSPVQGGKKYITFFETPLTPAGAMDFADFKFGFAAQSVTLPDLVEIGTAMVSPKVPGGSFIKDIKKIENQLRSFLKPLSVVQMRNPKPIGEYKFADKNHPFPPLTSFNLLILGPLANVDDSSGKTVQGPLLKAVGTARALGQEMGSMNVYLGQSGLRAKVSEDLSLKLGPLGKQHLSQSATIDVNIDKQLLQLHGYAVEVGRVLDVTLTPSKLSLYSPATCITPFELRENVDFQADFNIGSFLDSLPGANVDPSKLTGCIGKDLEKAYKWVATTGSSLGGYSAKEANQVLNQAANISSREYQKAKDAARDQANKTSNDAMHAFNDAGNAFKKLGTKHKHKKGPDPRFASSVFDWDYYYDRYPDVVKANVDLATHWKDNGFKEGRQGAPEFSAKYYRARYLDVQQLCAQKDYDCVLQHWLDNGIDEGRQGSANVSVADYLNRYSDLQKLFGTYNYADALDHWLNSGEDEHRNSKPESASDDPMYGPQKSGGDGGGYWDDKCEGQYVTGFKLFHGSLIDKVQFRYNKKGWAQPHGNLGKPDTVDVSLPDGDYIVEVKHAGGSMLDSVTFITNKGKTYGPYGGSGGTPQTFKVNTGEKLGCMSGRSGSLIDRIVFSSTGIR